jgi:hypothetical protein
MTIVKTSSTSFGNHIWACNTTYYHDPSCMITPASLNRWIVFSSMQSRWSHRRRVIHSWWLTLNAFFLPHPLTSALPLLHRIRYCYSRATLETTWWSERHNRRAYVIGWRDMCTFIRDDGLLRCIFFSSSDFCLASSSSYCIRYCYITNWRHVLPLLHRTVSGIAISPIGGHVYVHSQWWLAKCIFLPSPLTSVLLLLHRSRYCYSRASLAWEHSERLTQSFKFSWVWQGKRQVRVFAETGRLDDGLEHGGRHTVWQRKLNTTWLYKEINNYRVSSNTHPLVRKLMLASIRN